MTSLLPVFDMRPITSMMVSCCYFPYLPVFWTVLCYDFSWAFVTHPFCRYPCAKASSKDIFVIVLKDENLYPIAVSLHLPAPELSFFLIGLFMSYPRMHCYKPCYSASLAPLSMAKKTGGILSRPVIRHQWYNMSWDIYWTWSTE